MRYLIAAIAVVAPAALAAQGAPIDGTYVLEGGSYAIRVRQVGATLEVVEPNRTSIYTPQPDGSWHTYSEAMQRTYALRVIDDRTLEAFKPDSDAPPTRLTRLGPVPTIRAVPLPPSSASGEAAPVAAPTGGNADGAIADAYLARTRSDPTNAQAWAFCSAAALKRSMGTGAEADAYGREAAAALKAIAVDPAASPCPDAIPPALWDAAGDADGATPAATLAPAPPERDISVEEEERLRRLNADADARARAYNERRDAELKAQAARDAAYRAEQERYARDRAAFEAADAAAKAAQERYDRELEAHRRLVESGNFRKPD